MPLVAHLKNGIWEVRTKLSARIARVLFVLDGGVMVLLHGFIKKEKKTPKPELDLAKDRLKLLNRKK
jgi:phage-related protein